MAAESILADLELFLTGWYRTAWPGRPTGYCPDVAQWDRVEPDPAEGAFRTPFVVIRDDGGPLDLLGTADRSVGISVLAGTREDPRDAFAVARMILALRTRIPSPDAANPVAAVTGANGPYLVAEEQPFARVYSTIDFRVVGSPLNP